MTTPPVRSNPYVGPRAYQAGERLYGRARELDDLRDLLVAERIVLLYSPSGAGKSSLIQAALIPELARRRFRVRPVARVNTPPPLGVPPEANRYMLSVLLALEQDRPAPAPGEPTGSPLPAAELARLNLATYLDRRSAAEGVADEVLIFDQFEEVLTLDPTDGPAKTAFFAGLRDALRDRRRWALFALREDFLAGLDPYRATLPGSLATTYRLDLLGPAAARQAIQAPARAAGVDFADAAAGKLVDDLRRVQVQRADGTTAEQPGPYVEPVQLQVVCRGLWERLPAGATTIAEAEVTGVGEVDSALADYYAASVSAAATTTGIPERRIRDWCEERLTTPGGIRGQVLHSPVASDGLANAAIAALVQAHLVRAEERRGATWYELAHDRLIGPLRADNARWRQGHLQPWQRQARLWSEQGKPRGLLLRGAARRAAADWAATHPAELTGVERELLVASAEAVRTARNQALAGGAVGLVLLILLVNSLVVLRTNNATTQAEQARATAIGAEATSEIRRQAAVAAQATADVQRQAAVSAATAVAQANVTAEAGRQNAVAAQITTEAQRQTAVAAVTAAAAAQVTIEAARQTAVAAVTVAAGAQVTIEAARRVDQAKVLAADAVFLLDYDPEQSILLATEALQNFDPGSKQAASALHQALLRYQVLYTFPGFTAAVTCVRFSPNGARLLTGSADGTVAIWDAGSKQQVASFLAQPGGVRSAEWSPAGRLILTAGSDGTAKIWNAATGQALATLAGHKGPVLAAAWSPDGQSIATAGADGLVLIWDAGGKTQRVLARHANAVLDVAWSPSSKNVVTTDDGPTATIWDVAQTREVRTLAGHRRAINSVAWSPDGGRIVTASDDGTALTWNALTGQQETAFLAHRDPVLAAAWSLDSRTIVTAGADAAALVWDARNGKLLQTLRGHKDAILSAAWSPDQHTLVTASRDQTVRLWTVDDRPERPTLQEGPTQALNSAFWSPDGLHILTASSDGSTRVWDPVTGHVQATFTETATVYSAAWSPDGRRIATARSDGKATIWNLATGRSERVLQQDNYPLLSVAWSPDGQSLAVGSRDKTAIIWNLASGKARFTLTGHTEAVLSVTWSPNGTKLLTGSDDNYARIWDAGTGKPLNKLTGHKDSVRSALYNNAGTRIVTASADGTAMVWDAGGQPLGIVLHGHIGTVLSAVYSPDGSTIATTGDDGTARIWDATGGPAQITLLGHAGAVNTAAWSPNGRILVTASNDGTARQYLMSVDDLLVLARSRVTRGLTPAEQATYLGALLTPTSPAPASATPGR